VWNFKTPSTLYNYLPMHNKVRGEKLDEILMRSLSLGCFKVEEGKEQQQQKQQRWCWRRKREQRRRQQQRLDKAIYARELTLIEKT
jgi:hypothetical protein